MATIYTHAVAGLGLAALGATRPMPWAYWGLAACLPILPDLDAFSDAAYGASLGHRGITHSLLFAAVVGLAVAHLTFRRLRANRWALTILFIAIIASHGLLDALTKGGMEIPFFWPMDSRFGNYGPLPVSDIAFDLPDPRYSRAVRAELLRVWLPTAVVVGVVAACRYLRRRMRGDAG